VKQHEATRYGGISQLLHWVTAVLVVYAFSNGLGGSEARVYLPSHNFQRQLHETVGLCVLALVVVRSLWRTVETRPKPVEAVPWMHTVRRVVEVALYVLLFAVPLTAAFGAWLEGHPLTLLGGWSMPVLPIVSHDGGATLSRLHTWLGDAIIWVGVFHALAALYHHFILKDAALISMLPTWLPVHQLSFSKRRRANTNTDSFPVSK
jgi:cytochrome b561